MILIPILAAIFTITGQSQVSGNANPASAYRDSLVLVGFQAGVDSERKASIIALAGGLEVRTIGVDVHVVAVASGQVSTAIQWLKSKKEVRYAEPDFKQTLSGGSAPNDTNFGVQWAALNVGQTVNGDNGTPGADERSLQAWSITTGGNSVVVAVLDTGVQYSHPDLVTNIWNNPGGIGGCPAGTHGYNVLAGTCDPLDDDSAYGGHGTHVAGILGAVGNNAAGVTGVNWTTSILPVKWVDSNDTGYTSDLITALDWVVQVKKAGVNVRVVNDSATWPGTAYSQALSDEIDLLGTNDILFVAASGNTAQNNDTTPRYPCSYDQPNMICVAASDQNDNLWSSANYGKTTVKLVAPGVNIYSTLRSSNYGYISGGSMAAPQVSGAAALILSLGYQSVTNLRSTILNNVDVLPSLNGVVATGGRLNICKAANGCAGSTSTPANATLPAITGLAQFGQLAAASTGVWNGLPTQYSYQWARCDNAGANCSNIKGAVNATYALLAPADVGATLRVTVTASNGAGAASAQSNASGAISNAVSPFGITSTIANGQPVSGVVQWVATPAQAVNFVQFYIDGVLSQTVSSSPYGYSLDSTTVPDGNHVLGIRALSSDNRTYGFSGASVSIANAPQNTSLPTVSGTPTSGQVLTTSNGSWTNNPSSFAYGWYRCNSAGAFCTGVGASVSSYTLSGADVGFTIRSSVTATNSTGSNTATSAPTTVIQAPGGGGSTSTAVALTSSLNPSSAGTSVTFTAKISWQGGGGVVASSIFNPPAESPLSEGGKWFSPINPSSSVAIQKSGANSVFPSAINNDSSARYVGQTFSGDQFSQATIANQTGSTVEGVLVRISSNSASSYALLDLWGSFYTILRINDNGSEMKFVEMGDTFGAGRLMDFAVTPRIGDVLRLEVSGSPYPTLKAYANGVLLGSVVDTGTSDQLGSYSPLSGGQPGIYLFVSSGGNVTDAALRNWSGGDLGGTASGTPTGSVDFRDGSTDIGSAPLNASAVATLTTSVLSADSHSITAVYPGDTNFAGSVSPALSQQVNAVVTATSTSVISLVNPSTAGASVTFTATVSSGSGTPSGNVSFHDGATVLGTSALNGSGQASFSTSTLGVGSHSITAAYGGAATFAGSTSPALVQHVNPLATSTTVISSLNPSIAGASVTFTATVSSGSGTPSGNVSFQDGAMVLGTSALNGSGQASFSTSTLGVGSHSITAVYGGAPAFTGSTSLAITQQVNAAVASTLTTVVSSLNPSTAGASVTFTATVSSSSGTPTGNVSFQDGATVVGTAPLNGSGQASFSTSALSVGSHSITAFYGGAATFAGSASLAINQQVNGNSNATSIVVSSSVDPSVSGQSVTLTASVTASSGTPTGTITFLDGGSSLGVAPLSGTPVNATWTTTLSAGIHMISAVYSGDGTFSGSTSAVFQQVVIGAGHARSATTVTSSPNPSATGQTVTFTAAVSATGGYSALSTFDGPPESVLSRGGQWTTQVQPPYFAPIQSDGNHNIQPSMSDVSAVARYDGKVFLEDQFSQATISSRGGSTMEAVVVRMQSDTTSSGYALVDYYGAFYSIARLDDSFGYLRFIETASTFNGGRLMDFAVAPQVGDVMRLEVSGGPNPTLTAYVNGTLLGSVVDTGASDWAGVYPPLLGGQPGVLLYMSGGSITPQLTNWSGGDIGAPTVPTSPTGTVLFYDGAAKLGSSTVNSSGQATFATSTLGAGSHPIIAVYEGDTNYVGGTAPAPVQAVNP